MSVCDPEIQDWARINTAKRALSNATDEHNSKKQRQNEDIFTGSRALQQLLKRGLVEPSRLEEQRGKQRQRQQQQQQQPLMQTQLREQPAAAASRSGQEKQPQQLTRGEHSQPENSVGKRRRRDWEDAGAASSSWQ